MEHVLPLLQDHLSHLIYNLPGEMHVWWCDLLGYKIKNITLNKSKEDPGVDF